MHRPLILALALASCGHARNAHLDVVPTVPARADCRDGAQRCNDLVPERCTVADDVGRWYPLLPLAADLRPARCGARCLVTDGEAHCAGPETDGGAP